ncbi:MAG: HEAT repeat domain-containing protein [Phycisphaerae bacterium]|nr:HEAT repeat domain-containing protein [Phycisphaerae bacterium]
MNRIEAAMLCLIGLISPAMGAWDSDCWCGKPHSRYGQTAGTRSDTGRAKAQFPPHLTADYKHIRIELTIPDMNTPRLTGTATLTFAPIAGPLSELTLDAKAMDVMSVTCSTRDAEFTHDGRKLTVRFDPALPRGEAADIMIAYELNDPPLGLVWSPATKLRPGVPAQLHTQGQPETNSYWFPCHDFPNDKLTSEVIVTLPAGYTVISNGRLKDKSKSVASAEVDGVSRLVAYEKWHYSQDKPHASYLVSLVAGKFDIVDLGTRVLPMPVYAPLGRGGDVKGTYGRTPAMVAFFAHRLSEPYPWDKYGQVLVADFGAGGMENTSITTMYDGAIVAKDDLDDTDFEGLISHELAHQWFGDLTTCNSWEHIWLNEGFATFLTALWFEHGRGPGEYEKTIRGYIDGIIANDRPEAPAVVGMVSNIYTHPWETFRRPANPYGKGASILHMLRRRLGDEVFFRGVAAFIDRHKFNTVETIDLRNALEAESGDSLEQFFAQWCYRPGVPQLDMKFAWDDGNLTVTAVQKQPINGDNPAFEFDLPLAIKAKGQSDLQWHTLRVRGRETQTSFSLSAEPEFIAGDPRQEVLAGLEISQPVESWLAQLSQGPTLWSRVQAVRGLKCDASVRSADVLRRLVLDRSQAPWIRAEAVRTLSARRAENDIRSLATAASDHWEVRLSIVEALPSLSRDEKGLPTPAFDHVERILRDRAVRDSSVKVRAAALRALGQITSESSRDLFLSALEEQSRDDLIRLAALEAIVSMNQADAIKSAIRFSGPEYDSRTRAAAAGAIARAAANDPDAALETLVALLSDRSGRVKRGAGDALVQLKDRRAMPALEALAADQRSQELSWQASEWVRALSAVGTPAAP